MSEKRVMRFVGVTTGGSSINKVFPLWSEILDLNAELVGLDIPIGAPASQYRAAINEMATDASCAGALVTTHKIAMFSAAKDMFESFDQFAAACGEVSSVKVSSGKVFGAAKDPITAGLSIEEFISRDHFNNGADVLCFGDGGAATAIAWYLTGLEFTPRQIHFFGINQDRLNHLREVVAARLGASAINTNISNDDLVKTTLENLNPGSLIINATGMGKDIPGSPMPAGSHFPLGSIIWELNYRGSLEFLHHAKAEQDKSKLRVHDGWRYFIHGWSNVVSEVFDIKLTPQIMEKLSAAAEIAK